MCLSIERSPSLGRLVYFPNRTQPMGLCLGGIPILITPICLGAKRLLHQVNRGILNTRPSNLFAWNDEETEEVDFTSMASLSPSSKQTRLRGYRVRWTQRTLTKALLLGSITLAVAIRRAFQHLCMGRKKVVLLEKKQANETIDMLCVCVCRKACWTSSTRNKQPNKRRTEDLDTRQITWSCFFANLCKIYVNLMY